jgi:tRNA-splicing ligase RtcB
MIDWRVYSLRMEEEKMIQWERNEDKLPIRSWCREVDELALTQARNLANHPAVRDHVALMPDAHGGFGMPIGGVIACEEAVIPNAVGVDIGCGMGAIKTSLHAEELGDRPELRELINEVKARIPAGEGHPRKMPIGWTGFGLWEESIAEAEKPGWYSGKARKLDACNLGTLGGGNHFIEIQRAEDDSVWLMLHSGSRNLGARIAAYYHKAALALNQAMGVGLPDPYLAYLPADHDLGKNYIRDMNHALAYAMENRRIMMEELKAIMALRFPAIRFLMEVNIHHNYAAEEEHDDAVYWIHRKGATSAGQGELGIIPGSMGTASYIVEGLGNPASFRSCSHGAGRRLGRAQANRTLRVDECDKAMEGVVCDRWSRSRTKGPDGKWLPDLSEAPLAYKDIDDVIQAESDLVKPLVKLRPIAVLKG